MSAIRAGYLINPENGSVAKDQIILIEDGKIKEIGKDISFPKDAVVVDLSKQYVLPGLVDAHDHLTLTYKRMPENNYYYLTTIMDSSPLRAV